MARFYFNPKNNLIIVNNISHKKDIFFVDETNGNLIVNIITENSADKPYKQPLFAVINIKNNIVSVYGSLKLIEWNSENYDVIYEMPTFNYYTPPVATLQENYNLRGSQHTVTLFHDNSLHLLCEYDRQMSTFNIDYNIIDAKLLLQPTSLGFLIILTANTENEFEYLNLILYDGKYTQLYEDTADKITFSKSSFEVTKKMHDMLGRESHKTLTFSKATFVETELTFTYNNDKEYPNELVPYLFLEAIKANDKMKATNYLCDDLVEMLPHFKDYFGDFISIETPKYQDTPTKNSLLTVALIYELKHPINTPKYFKFILSEGKISNITD